MVIQVATEYQFGTRVMVKPYGKEALVHGAFAPTAWRVLKETPKGFIAVRDSDWELVKAEAGQEPSEVVPDSLASYLPKEYVAAFDDAVYRKLSTLAKQVDGLRRRALSIWNDVLEG